MVNRKRCFCKIDRKRFYIDSVNSFAYGHPDIPRKAVKRKVTDCKYNELNNVIENDTDNEHDNDESVPIPTSLINLTGHISKKCKYAFK